MTNMLCNGTESFIFFRIPYDALYHAQDKSILLYDTTVVSSNLDMCKSVETSTENTIQQVEGMRSVGVMP